MMLLEFLKTNVNDKTRIYKQKYKIRHEPLRKDAKLPS